jgi:transcriptional regulator with XRE-family HTH domain
MDSSFGTRLRLQREEQQIPLATIAEKTKIKLSLLEGLERDDVSRWPSGIFRRSYFRAYAGAIGLDSDQLLREFQALYPDPDAQDVTQALVEARLNAHSRRPPTRLRCLIDSAVNALPALHLQQSLKQTSEPPNGHRPEPVFEAAPVPTAVAPEPEPPPTLREEEGVDFAAVAQLCTRLGRALDVSDVTPVLEDAAAVLRSIGLTLWVRDQLGFELEPVFAHGYSTETTAQLPRVSRDSDNAIARAFRTAEARVVDGGDMATGAVVVPLLTPTGCAGVLALELRHGSERLECVRAAATILAAQLSTLFGVPVLAEAVSA